MTTIVSPALWQLCISRRPGRLFETRRLFGTRRLMAVLRYTSKAPLLFVRAAGGHVTR